MNYISLQFAQWKSEESRRMGSQEQCIADIAAKDTLSSSVRLQIIKM